jgi:hypothetical protein
LVNMMQNEKIHLQVLFYIVWNGRVTTWR